MRALSAVAELLVFFCDAFVGINLEAMSVLIVCTLYFNHVAFASLGAFL